MSTLESQQFDDVTMELEGFMSFQKKMMFYLGFWSVNNEPHNVLYYWRYYLPRAIIWYVLTCIFSLQLPDIFLTYDNLLIIFEEVLLISVGLYLCVTQWTIFSMTDEHKELVLILQKMNEDRRLSDDSRRLSQKFQTLSHNYAVFVCYGFPPFIAATIGSYFLCVHLGLYPPRLTFYRAYFPYDVTSSPNYELTMCMQGLNVILFFVCGYTYETVMVTIFVHIIIQFKILRHKLQNLRTHAETNVRKNDWMDATDVMTSCTTRATPQSLHEKRRYNGKNEDNFTKNVHLEMRRHLMECMEHHKQLLRTVHLVTEISYLKLSFILGWNLTGCILFELYIDLAPGFDVKQFFSLYVLLLSLGILLLYSALSTELCNESSLIGEALYSCDWVDAPEDFKRDIRIFMTIVNQPTQIVLLKFVPLSLDTFQSVVHTAYSYYTVMNKLAH